MKLGVASCLLIKCMWSITDERLTLSLEILHLTLSTFFETIPVSTETK